ncbi:hypothetical protein OPKNFCMD_6492 [Methylobacterium crusticola]|uniref:DUF3617 family protein n=1 Tax=Methylobacterium crusticola TaxID=1697972 RepID=A0ABQ4R915_9HYPH|nr:hypothetical protein [Methylobacterium crusticola]GJD53714.1 hypothetical protein OPKNFCMD_6492 [Methylobacterium crusticola]
MLTRLVPILVLVASPALARSAPYVGVWAQKPADCGVAIGDGSGSPMEITKTTVSGWEYRCDIRRVSATRAGWTMRLACASEGTESTETMRFQLVDGGHLHETGSWGTHDYVRCRRD